MGCNCGKQKRVETKVIMGESQHQFVTIPVVTMVPEPTPTPLPEEDHFNNIDTITPIDNG